MAVRPEAVRLSSADGEGVAGEVMKSIYLGNHVEYVVRSPLGELFVIEHYMRDPIPPGTGVSIDLTTRGVTLLPSRTD